MKFFYGMLRSRLVENLVSFLSYNKWSALVCLQWRARCWPSRWQDRVSSLSHSNWPVLTVRFPKKPLRRLFVSLSFQKSRARGVPLREYELLSRSVSISRSPLSPLAASLCPRYHTTWKQSNYSRRVPATPCPSEKSFQSRTTYGDSG